MLGKGLNIDFDSLRNDVFALFSEDHHAIRKNFVVSKEEQQKEINLLKETLGSERFFFIVDLLNFEIQEVHGIQKWMGYSEKDFSLKHYWNHLMHPSRKQSLLLIARQMYDVLCRGTYQLEFMVQRFASLTPLKHHKGHYLLVKKGSSTFQYDTRNRLTAYINEFTIVGDYEGEALSPNMYNKYGEKEGIKQQEIMQKVMESFLRMKVFSVGELQVVRKLAYHPGLTQAKIANELGLSTNTVDTHYKRFLEKARAFYSEDFHTVHDAALRLRKEGLL